MNKYTFEQLPELVGKLIEKVEAIEQLLSEKPEPIEMDEIFTVEQASVFLRLAIPTIYTKVCRGELPADKPGKRLYFKKSELLKWMDSGKKSTNKDSNVLAEKFSSINLGHARRKAKRGSSSS